MKKNSSLTLKGFRDLLPEEAKLKQKLITLLQKIFEEFGFQPLETPTLEYASTLLGKYGQEADKLIYTFRDKGGREVGLRYDLTVPTCKVLALYQDKITLPFKRYQIQNLFRAEKPQRGRFREFTQCDIDIFGISSPLADGEIIFIIYTALKRIGLKEFVININSRQVLASLLEKVGVKEKKKQLSLLQSIDKLDKKPKAAVEEELKEKKITSDQIRKIFKALKTIKPDKELKQIFSFLKSNHLPEKHYQFNPTMVRGLDYYTRAIFETYVTRPKIGSVTGGGRYDNLVAQLGGPSITGTGSSIGLERIVEVIKEENLWPETKEPTVKALITIFSPSLQEEAIKLSRLLRKEKIPVELYLDPEAKLEKQLKYADRKGIPWAIIIGPREKEEKTAVLKNLQKRKQETIAWEKIPFFLK